MSQRERPVQANGGATQGEIPVPQETALGAGKYIQKNRFGVYMMIFDDK